MNIDNYEDYFKYKIKTVYQYSILLSKILGIDKNKLWHKKKDTEDSLNYIINDYFNKITIPVDKDLVRCFINNKEILKYNIERELDSVITYFIDKERGICPKEFAEIEDGSWIVSVKINNEDISKDEPMVKVLEEIFKEKGLHEFKKAEFAHLVKQQISSENDISEEIKLIINNIKKLFHTKR